MKKYFAVFAILLACNPSFAQRFKVQKVKGNKAIIESSTPLEEGRTYTLTPNKISEDVDYSLEGHKSRKNSIALGGSVDSLSSGGTSSTTISFDGKYGWNFTTLEGGPFLRFVSVDSSNSYLLGGYIDYNFQPNRDGVSSVLGVTGNAAFGSTASSGSSSQLISAFTGGTWKWFVFNSSGAIRTDFGFKTAQTKLSSSTTTSSGLVASFALAFYF